VCYVFVSSDANAILKFEREVKYEKIQLDELFNRTFHKSDCLKSPLNINTPFYISPKFETISVRKEKLVSLHLPLIMLKPK
jgi:hypothetical protein